MHASMYNTHIHTYQGNSDDISISFWAAPATATATATELVAPATNFAMYLGR